MIEGKKERRRVALTFVRIGTFAAAAGGTLTVSVVGGFVVVVVGIPFVAVGIPSLGVVAERMYVAAAADIRSSLAFAAAAVGGTLTVSVVGGFVVVVVVGIPFVAVGIPSFGVVAEGMYVVAAADVRSSLAFVECFLEGL